MGRDVSAQPEGVGQAQGKQPDRQVHGKLAEATGLDAGASDAVGSHESQPSQPAQPQGQEGAELLPFSQDIYDISSSDGEPQEEVEEQEEEAAVSEAEVLSVATSGPEDAGDVPGMSAAAGEPEGSRCKVRSAHVPAPACLPGVVADLLQEAEAEAHKPLDVTVRKKPAKAKARSSLHSKESIAAFPPHFQRTREEEERGQNSWTRTSSDQECAPKLFGPVPPQQLTVHTVCKQRAWWACSCGRSKVQSLHQPAEGRNFG